MYLNLDLGIIVEMSHLLSLVRACVTDVDEAITCCVQKSLCPFTRPLSWKWVWLVIILRLTKKLILRLTNYINNVVCYCGCLSSY